MKTALLGCGCIPWVMNGGAVRHSAHCRVNPNVKLTTQERESWLIQNRAANNAELRRVMAEHPANGTKQPLRSVSDPDYIDAHIDDRDDDG